MHNQAAYLKSLLTLSFKSFPETANIQALREFLTAAKRKGLVIQINRAGYDKHFKWKCTKVKFKSNWSKDLSKQIELLNRLKLDALERQDFPLASNLRLFEKRLNQRSHFKFNCLFTKPYLRFSINAEQSSLCVFYYTNYCLFDIELQNEVKTILILE